MKFNVLIFIFAIFSSCDCLQHVHGVVIDSETQLPINNVTVTKASGLVIYTDSIGRFDFTSMTGGLFGCPKIVLSFEKEGYNKIIKKYKSCCTDNNILFLKRKE
jgi:hypothetical protein